MKAGTVLMLITVAALIGAFALDAFYIPRFEKEFKELEEQRILVSNKLATAKIVHENLNHVRDLVFKNMDFPGQNDTVPHETHFFDFVTTCVNDLKLELISVKPKRPVKKGRITTYSYDIEIEGDFFKFGELCSKFENSRRIVALETYEVQLVDGRERSRGGPENKLVKVKMNVDTYRVKKSAGNRIVN